MTLPSTVWTQLSHRRWLILIVASSTLAALGLILAVLATDTTRMNLIINGGWVQNGWPFHTLTTAGYALLYATNTALWCAAIFAFGHQYLNRNARALPALNRAVYPFYIFHFPVLMVGLYYLRSLSWPWFPEFLILTIGTFFGTGLLVFLCDKIPFMRPLVGLSRRKPN